MKKLLFLSLLILGSIASQAQHTRPRFGIVPSEGNTYQSLSIGSNLVADATGADTIRLYPGNYTTYVLPGAIKDSVVYAIASTKGCYKGDQIEFICTNTSGTHYVRFTNALQTGGVKPFVFAVNAADSTTTLTSALGMYMKFVFDGSQWIEVNKTKE